MEKLKEALRLETLAKDVAESEAGEKIARGSVVLMLQRRAEELQAEVNTLSKANLDKYGTTEATELIQVRAEVERLNGLVELGNFEAADEWSHRALAAEQKVAELELARTQWEATALVYARSRGCQEEMTERAEAKVAEQAKQVEALRDEVLVLKDQLAVSYMEIAGSQTMDITREEADKRVKEDIKFRMKARAVLKEVVK